MIVTNVAVQQNNLPAMLGKRSVKTFRRLVFVLYFMAATFRWASLWIPVHAVSRAAFLAFVVFVLKDFHANARRKPFENVVVVGLLITYLLSFFVGLSRPDFSIVVGIRFYVTLLFLQIAFYVKKDPFYIRAVVAIAVLQSLVITLTSLYMLAFESIETYDAVRQIVRDAGIGDIYTFDGFYWQVQLSGNSILPVALFIVISDSISFAKHRRVIVGCLVVGTIVSGHFAFFIAIATFFVLRLILHSRKNFDSFVMYLVLGCFLAVGVFLVGRNALVTTLDRRGEHSTPVRVEQINLISEEMVTTSRRLLWGYGIGSAVDRRGVYRDYSLTEYFELQALYVWYQLGTVVMSISLILHLFLFYIKVPRVYWAAYFCYLLYGAINPYILNSMHGMIVTAMAGSTTKPS